LSWRGAPRPNRWRGLKTKASHRVIPLWPQLEAILRAWVFGPRLERGGTLLVPSWTAQGEERRLRDIHRLLDRMAKRAGLGAGELRSKAFRHTRWWSTGLSSTSNDSAIGWSGWVSGRLLSLGKTLRAGTE
jgi:integrase